MKKLHPKVAVLGIIGLVTLLGLFVYMNESLRSTRASADRATISFNPQSSIVDVTKTHTTTMFLQTDDSTKKISGFDITLSGVGVLQYLSVGEVTAVGNSNLTFRKIVHEVSPNQVRLAYVVQAKDQDLPNIIQTSISFRGTAQGQGRMIVENAEVVGTATGTSFDTGTPAQAVFGFTGPTPTPAPVTSTPTLRPTNTPIPTKTPTPTPLPSGCFTDNSGAVVCTPPAPTNVKATPVTTQAAITVSWNPVSGANVYSVRQSTTSGGPYIVVASTASTSFTNTNLQPGKTYYYVVTAANNYGAGAPSNEVFATVIVPPTATPTPIPTATPRPTATPTPIPTATPRPTATLQPCPKHLGDANCDYKIDLLDFEIWRKEFVGEVNGRRADFNSSGRVDLVDYEIWRRTFFNQ